MPRFQGSHMHRFCRPLIATSLLCATALPAAAQTRAYWSVQGSALYTALGGRANGGIEPGAGFELQGRRRINPLLSMGCGIQGTSHSLTGGIGGERMRGVFCEPRRVVDVNSESVFPYVSARLSVLRRSIFSDSLRSGALGAGLALGLGTVLPMSSTSGRFPMLFEVGTSAGYTLFSNYAGDGYKTGSGRGWSFILRLGLAVGLPFGDPQK